MPCVGALCEITGEPKPWDDCLECSRSLHRCKFTPELLTALARNADERRDAGISVTMLTGCLRKAYYDQVLEYYHYPTRLYPASRGTAFHYWLEQYPLADRIYETRFCRVFYLASGERVQLSGKMDVLDPLERLIIDYKSKREERVPKSAAGVSEEYVWQLNGYRLILESATVVTPSKLGRRLKRGEEVAFPIDRLGIVYLTMDGPTKFPVPALPLDQVAAHLLPRLESLHLALALRAPPPREVDSPATSAFCTDWCPHRRSCTE